MEVGIRPGHIVLDRTQLSLSKRGTALKGAQPPVFGSCLLWPNAWMDQDVAWYEGRPRRHCVRLGAHRKGAQQLPTFRPNLLWHGRPSQQPLNYCSPVDCAIYGPYQPFEHLSCLLVFIFDV